MKKILLACIAVAALFSAPVLAADMSVKMPVKAPVAVALYDWSGFYFGGSVGWADSSYDWRYTNPVPVTCCQPVSPSKSDLILSGLVGVQTQWNHWVLGIEGGVDGFPNSKFASGACIIGVGISCQIRRDTIWTVGGRLGWAQDNWLFYGDGGWATSKVHSQLLFPGGPAIDQTNAKYNDGWYAGAGVDYVIYRGPFDVIAGLEYQHIDLGSKVHLSAADGFTPCPPGANCRAIGATEDIVRLRLTFKTGWGKTPVVAKY